MEEVTTSAMAAIDAGRGSFVNLLTRSGARYQGYVSRVDSLEFLIALTDVKCFGTEGRRMDGQDYSGSEKIYEFMIFRGSEVIELQFLTSPPAQIGFVPNYMVGSIAQTMQNPGETAIVAGLQHPPLLPVTSTYLYPLTTPESSLQMASQPVSQSFATPSELQYLTLPPAQIGFVPIYMPESIVQTSTYTLLPMQNPGGTATVAGLQHPPLLPVGSPILYPLTTDSSSGQFATPESSLQTASHPPVSQSFPTRTTRNASHEAVSQSFPTPSTVILISICSLVFNFLMDVISLQASHPQVFQPFPTPTVNLSAQLLNGCEFFNLQASHQPVSQSFPTPRTVNAVSHQPVSQSFPTPNTVNASHQPVSQSFPTPSALGGLLPTPQPGRGGLLPTPQGSSGRGRGSVASGQGRGRQLWRRASGR
ncbi:PREDICTED: protein decapping 5-like [Ipomoea nil]|uniref:protein decapping 5-like n=1 Tax=Ipomoea nil TaxID=35883 RepID=UPI000900D2CC|nr:PREDICTED: protein decapping 5-like [Ipomoea nil]